MGARSDCCGYRYFGTASAAAVTVALCCRTVRRSMLIRGLHGLPDPGREPGGAGNLAAGAALRQPRRRFFMRGDACSVTLRNPRGLLAGWPIGRQDMKCSWPAPLNPVALLEEALCSSEFGSSHGALYSCRSCHWGGLPLKAGSFGGTSRIPRARRSRGVLAAAGGVGPAPGGGGGGHAGAATGGGRVGVPGAGVRGGE